MLTRVANGSLSGRHYTFAKRTIIMMDPPQLYLTLNSLFLFQNLVFFSDSSFVVFLI